MRCPKCGYVSFDFNMECPKCQCDMSAEQKKLHLPPFKPSPSFFLRKLLGSEESPAETFIADADDLLALETEHPEKTDVERGVFLQAEYADSFAGPSHAMKHIEEIKELISELMPAKNNAEPQKKKP
jgi:hypothetical protein